MTAQIPHKLKFLFIFLIVLFILALPTSIAGIEATSWSIALILFLYSLVERLKFKRKTFIDIEYGWTLWGFWAVVFFGALLIDGIDPSDKIFMIGDLRWILLLYVWSTLFYQFQSRQERAFSILMSILVVGAVYGIVQFPTGIDIFRGISRDPDLSDRFWRSKGFFSNTMTFSYSYGMWFCLLLTSSLLGLGKTRWQRIAIWAATFVVGSSLILTFTRGLWIALVAASGILFFRLNKTWFYRFLAGLILCASLSYITILPVRNRIDSIFSTTNVSNSHRLNIWRANWEMFKEHPLLGVGYRQNSRKIESYYKKLEIENGFIGHAHNNILQVLAGTGLLGFIFWSLFNISALISAFRLQQIVKKYGSTWDKVVAYGGFSALCLLHIGGITESNFFDGEVNHSMVVICALIFSLSYQFKTKNQSSS